MSKKEMVLDIGREGYDRLEVNWDEETGFILTGITGSGKSNLIHYLVSQVLDHGDKEVHVFSNDKGFFYKKANEKFDQFVEMENKLHKIRAGLNRLKKEVERREKRVEKKGKTFEEIAEDPKGEKVGDWTEKLIVVDGYDTHWRILMQSGKTDQADKHRELLEYIVNHGPAVGIKVMMTCQRNISRQAPESIVEGLSVKGSMMSSYEDQDRWDLIVEDAKEPKKVGEMYVKVGDRKSFVKTYNLMKYAEEKKGIFQNWNPYIGLDK